MEATGVNVIRLFTFIVGSEGFCEEEGGQGVEERGRELGRGVLHTWQQPDFAIC